MPEQEKPDPAPATIDSPSAFAKGPTEAAGEQQPGQPVDQPAKKAK